MDLWVVGAAAAAGYIAKYWQNVSRDKDSLSGSELSKCEKHENPSFPLCRSTRRKKLTGAANTGEKFSDMYRLDSASELEVSSSAYAEKRGSSGDYDESNILSLSSPSSGVTMNEILIGNGSDNGLRDDTGDNSGSPCTGEMDSFHESKMKTSSLRTKNIHGHFIKPLNSLESCLMAQLYKEHTKMEEYVLSVFPSPSKKMRPLLVTDGNQIINRLNNDSFSASIGTDDNRLPKDENACGVPPLPKISKFNVPKKIKFKAREVCNGRFSNSHKAGSGRHFHSQNVGIASSLLASRREVDKLQDLLKQTENLVQDLQEELEMKDSLTVKELADEKCESQDTCENSLHYRALNPLFPLQNVNNSTNNDGKESQSERAEDNSEDMSKIEAELEAELERLGLNMNKSSLERILSDGVELDPDVIADLAQGELRVDMFNGRAVCQPESDRDKSGTPTTHSGNYAVSPQELSLRLHEVIESQLEERVKQLEMALQNSQQKVLLMESEHKNVWRKFSNNELTYSSDEESPITEENINSTAQPLVMNLSGDALEAYNEAYEELMKINESEEDDSPSTAYESMHPYNQIMLQCCQDGATNGSMTRLRNNKEIPSSRESCGSQLKVAIKHSQGIQKLLYDDTSEDENSGSSDEMEKQLIKQIVEKTRKGSPVVLNAQRLLFSMDENKR
ncbi:hypothetical protein RCOM_1469830 [Ricinus communis]|uniref:Uncharacterized protein n=1 Tax=Ricinus communis TaxID=3988 RepID=B9RLN7_RICCO|nr:hypothetical protein RCOM_1469830 [Ricinus communis]